MRGGPLCPRSRSRNNHNFLPSQSQTAQRALGCIVGQADAAIGEEALDGRLARNQVVHRLGDGGMAAVVVAALSALSRAKFLPALWHRSLRQSDQSSRSGFEAHRTADLKPIPRFTLHRMPSWQNKREQPLQMMFEAAPSGLALLLRGVAPCPLSGPVTLIRERRRAQIHTSRRAPAERNINRTRLPPRRSAKG